ncbi:cupin domain-containing protein [Natrinema thermotolerans]|uniref:Cupin domain-containing protein n=1 Tax=Natrinema thermotolerans TaxID=121872 RepID=A0AAF0PGH8_9EURY|nr:cupin domain-containing protein [Natrinema thermotolerans]QCC57728.1 cupin domain-containing protein [Natrinema thermotolerans]WMT08810.1 cupin domain-containing protein [Natrinema thermotolerans]
MEKVNDSDVDWKQYDREETTFRRKELSNAVDADDLGCSLYELPPGERSWPYHYHTANEEAIYVLAGDGKLRTPDGLEPLTAGDYATFPADESGGHRVVNDGDEPLRYLALSTMNEPDITVYPEMEKFGIYVGSPPGGRDERSLEGYYALDDEVEYWEGDERR